MRDQTGFRVLVIDDHRGIAARLGEMVERAGFRVSLAFGGREGIDAFDEAQSAGSPFSVIITDFSMADFDGLAVAATVKHAAPATKVILLTFYAIDADPLPPAIDAVLRKPPSDAELRSTLARLTAGAHPT